MIIINDSYQKARRSYMGFSGLLLGWEFIGINISQATLGTLNIELQNPEAVPSVLLILVLYFAYRISNEWFYLDSTARKTSYTRIDLTLSHLLGFSSALVFFYQKFSGDQLYDQFTGGLEWYIVTMLSSLLVMFVIYILKRNEYLVNKGIEISSDNTSLVIISAGIVLFFIIPITIIINESDSSLYWIYGISLIISVILLAIFKK